MIKLSELLRMSDVQPVLVAGDAAFRRIVSDSRQVMPGDLFVCMPSASVDTHQYLDEAVRRGAVAAWTHSREGVERAVELGIAAAQWPTDLIEFNAAIGPLCREFYSDPTLDLRVIGVTGTNGKTTVAWLLRQMLRALGRDAAYFGTLGYQHDGDLVAGENTTPFPIELWKTLAEARDAGVTDFVMEVSSHSLHQQRVAGVRFDLGVFTNLTQDHLDYHGTMDAYADAKRLLFTAYADVSEKPFVAVINADDETGSAWIDAWNASRIQNDPQYVPMTLSYGLERGTVRAEVTEVDVDHLTLQVTAGDGTTGQIDAPLGGRFNIENVLCVTSVLLALGYQLSEITDAWLVVEPVPGRFEAIPNERGVGVLVDYAHTEDALRKLLHSAKELQPKRLICVFGCGGDRDRTKRPKMAAASAELADLTIFTSDNPRTESPAQIFADLLSGVAGAKYEVIEDRREAIRAAIQQAQPGDLVVIAGKGHETYQILGKEKVAFDDRAIAREALR